MEITVWGCRGSLPVPGKHSMKYGGNTNCVTLEIKNKCFFIFDAGTGIKVLSNYLVKKNKFPLSATLFITHPHYDHIQGIPFFVPFYMKGNQFDILGADQKDLTFKKVISGQMDSVYFPITMKEFSADITFHSLGEGSFYKDDLLIKTLFLNHPGCCLGYRVEHKKKSFCYITDNELYLKNTAQFNSFDDDRLIQFIYKADVLFIDATYSDKDYKFGWGHSCISRVVDIANKAKVKLLCLYHHDPDQTDKDIDRKLQQAKSLLKSSHSKTRCIVPREGKKIKI